MNLQKEKLDKSYLLFKNWWDSTVLTNYEKYTLNKDIISLNQQLLRLKENVLRVGVYGKAGVGKSTILNCILRENFFKTDILNGSTKNFESKEISFNKGIIKTIELVDTPGFDSYNISNDKKDIKNLFNLDLILFVITGDLNRNELDKLSELIRKGKSIILILNKIDIWKKNELQVLKDNIKNKLPLNCKIPFLTLTAKYKKNYIYTYIINTINTIGYELIIYNTYQIANNLSQNIKGNRLIKGKKRAQSLIGKFATIKASTVAINPLLFLDIAGSIMFDTYLINELSKVYGLKIERDSVKKLIQSLSINNLYLGVSQVGINTTFNLLKKLSLIFAPFTNGLSLLPYGPIAIIQAALAVQTTRMIGKLAAKEIIRKSNANIKDPLNMIKQLASRDSGIININNSFIHHQNSNSDYSIFIP